jgi:hypothetical protein
MDVGREGEGEGVVLYNGAAAFVGVLVAKC